MQAKFLGTANEVSPAGAGVLVFCIAMGIAGCLFLPALVRPTSTKGVRLLSAICLALSVMVAAFLAFFGALNGTALNGRIDGEHYFVGDHGDFTEVSHFVYGLSAFATLGGLLSFLLLALCASILRTLQRNATRPERRWRPPRAARCLSRCEVQLRSQGRSQVQLGNERARGLRKFRRAQRV